VEIDARKAARLAIALFALPLDNPLPDGLSPTAE